MTVTPSGTETRLVRIVHASGVLTLVKAALSNNTEGLRDLVLSMVGNVRAVHQGADGSWPTIVRRDWLTYQWVGHPDVTPLTAPTTENGALPGDRLVGVVEARLPGDTVTTPETRTAALIEDFTGAVDGGPWPTIRWTPGLTPAGGGAVVQGGTGVLRSGATGGYVDEDEATIRASQQTHRDLEVQFDFTLPAGTGDPSLRLYLRASRENLMSRDLLAVFLTTKGIAVKSVTEWAWTDEAGVLKAHALGTVYRCRALAVTQTDGTTLIRARTWPATGTEPAVWDVEDTTTAVPAAGWFGFSNHGVMAATAAGIVIDNIRVYTRPAGSNPDWWGTPAGN